MTKISANKAHNIGFIALIIATYLFVAGIIGYVNSHEPQLMAMIDGRDVCIVESAKVFENEVNALSLRINGEVGGEFEFNGKISYRFVNALNDRVASSEQIEYSLLLCINDSIVEACAIYVDNQFIGAAKKYEDAYSVIKQIETVKTLEAKSNGDKFEHLKILNKIELRIQLCVLNELKSPEELSIMLDPTVSMNSLSVKFADSITSPTGRSANSASVSYDNTAVTDMDEYLDSEEAIKVAVLSLEPSTEYGILRCVDNIPEENSNSTLQNFNVSLTSQKSKVPLKSNSTESLDIKITNANSYIPTLKYGLTKTIEITEVIPFVTEYIESDLYFQGTEIITTYGSDGISESEYEYQIEYLSKIEYSCEKISENMIIEPVSQIVLRGTKPIPEALPTGEFIWPSHSYIVTSGYGEREIEGTIKIHGGIDISAPENDAVMASDGGKVIFSGFDKSYGNYIIIQHSDSFTTLYAHMSELLVELDDNVYPGQTIGQTGSTGDTTGFHIHFEIRINGITTNPEKYIKMEK